MRRRELKSLAKEGWSDEELDRLEEWILDQLKGILVIHSQEELDDAYNIGMIRHREAIAQNRPDAHGFDGVDGLAYHRLGAAGEYAAAKALGVPWERTVNTYKQADIAPNIQVRTRRKPDFDLNVRPVDRDDEIFLLVCRQSKFEFRVHGWLYGRDAKRVSPYSDPSRTNPIYYTPIADLDTIQSLVDRMTEAKSSDHIPGFDSQIVRSHINESTEL